MSDSTPDSKPAPPPAAEAATGTAGSHTNTTPTAAAVKPPAESRTVALYRAALGPVDIERTLKVFARFDTAGRARPVWHPAAAFFTLGWLVFRRLWTEALVYLALVAGVVAVGVALWPQLQTWPPGVRGGLLGTLLLLSLVLPGFLGQAWLHRRVRQRVLRAVAGASTMGEACAALSRRAGSPTQLVALLLAQAVLATGLLLGPVPCRSTACTGELRAWLAPAQPAPLAVGVLVEAAPAPGLEPLSARPAAPPVLPPAPLVAAVQPPEAAPAPPPTAAVPPPSGGAEVEAVTTTTTVAAGLPEATRPKVPDGLAVYAINVGLFADAGNAQRARDRLQQAGLPVVVQAISTAKGPRTRVRVGPFPRREAADEAAGRIRALGLEAVVFRP